MGKEIWAKKIKKCSIVKEAKKLQSIFDEKKILWKWVK